MMKKISLIILLFFSFNVLADTDPYYASKGFALPQDSWVFSPGKAKEVRNKLIDLETNLKLNESLSKSIELYKANEQIQQNKVNLLLEQNDKIVQRLNDSQSMNNIERIGLFLLGIIATVGAGYAIGQIHK